MHQSHPMTPSKPTISLGEIYYVLFKHKWMIALFFACGLLAAGLAYVFWPVVYRSEAQLFIKYVRETRSVPGMDEDSKIKSPDQRGGESIINNEVMILTSMDGANEVAAALPAEIVAKLGDGENRQAAAVAIRRGLTAAVPRLSSVIDIAFEHSDPEVVQPVLNLILEQYKKRHVEIHRPVGLFDDFLTQETDQLRSDLIAKERQLRELRSEAGVLSVEDTLKVYAEQISQVRQQIFEAETELAISSDVISPAAAASSSTNSGSAVAEGNTAAIPSESPAESMSEYVKINGFLDGFYRQEQEYLIKNYGSEHPLLQALRAQIREYEDQKADMEQKYPGLAALRLQKQNTVGGSKPSSFDPVAEAARIRGLQSKVNLLRDHLTKIYDEALALNEKAPTIADLERQIEMSKGRYLTTAASLDKARMEGALGPDRISNIGMVQNPTPPRRDYGKLGTILAGLVFGGVLVGTGVAFAWELYLNRNVRRPAEVEGKLGMPLMLSVPIVGANGKKELGLGKRKTDRNSGGEPALTGPGGKRNHAVAKPSELMPALVNRGLRTFMEALRDRLVFYFEVRNMAHKPKLIAVTGCSRGAGVSTVAAGLAETLSETGEGNVLLVDMNMGHHEPYHFHRGDLKCGLNELLDGANRDDAQVDDHLYVVSHATGEDKLSRIMPRRFNHLMPKLKASDYDYIIFDMPPVSQISVTPQLARYMDMVMMVVESEGTNRDAAKSACEMLSDSKANLSVVLNKTRNYVPARLRDDI